MTVQPYLFFGGRCAEALAFYRATFNAEQTMLMRFKDNPEPMSGEGCAGGPPPPDNVMHASLKIGDTELMMSDGMPGAPMGFQGFSLSVSANDEAHARKLFDAIAAEGQIQMPLGKTFFSPCFGCVADKFGVSWMVIVPAPMP